MDGIIIILRTQASYDRYDTSNLISELSDGVPESNKALVEDRIVCSNWI